MCYVCVASFDNVLLISHIIPGFCLKLSIKAAFRFSLFSDVKVEVPHAFPFPFPPYGIQLDLMRKLYEALELGKVGIFESPTGTVG